MNKVTMACTHRTEQKIRYWMGEAAKISKTGAERKNRQIGLNAFFFFFDNSVYFPFVVTFGEFLTVLTTQISS